MTNRYTSNSVAYWLVVYCLGLSNYPPGFSEWLKRNCGTDDPGGAIVKPGTLPGWPPPLEPAADTKGGLKCLDGISKGDKK